MPVLRIDYDKEATSDELIKEFSDFYLAEATKVYGMGKEFFSVFIRPYGKFDFSTAQIEIECFAGAHEYVKEGEDEKAVRERYAEELAVVVREWKKEKVQGGIISTITASHWKVTWID